MACQEVGALARFVVGVVEAGGYGGAEEGVAAAGAEAGALPDVAGDDHLGALAGFEVGADEDDPVGAVGVEVEHLDGVAQVEVEDLVGGEAGHGRERVGGQEVVDRGAGRAGGAVAGRQAARGDLLRAPEDSAQRLDGGHGPL
jgi:hypothetical protein